MEKAITGETFTLGQFFHIWGEKLSNNQIFDNK